MKITGTGPTDKTSGTKKAGGASKTGSTAFSGLLGEADDTAATSGAFAIARVDSLLAAQASDDPAERAARGRMMGRADNVLDELEVLRKNMLAGSMTVGQMVDIADVIATHREKIADPALTAILDEIDLRAQIELAKMAKALAQHNL